MVAVAEHQPVTRFVDLTHVGVDVGGDLGLQRSREHRPCTITHDLVEQRPARGAVLVGRNRVVDYLEHGRTLPNQRANRWASARRDAGVALSRLVGGLRTSPKKMSW
ncbi:MAG: hypothetical protein QOF66_92 [Mycobacterium sp.]|nr:hypothetical protein [Mycobacterium sp.]